MIVIRGRTLFVGLLKYAFTHHMNEGSGKKTKTEVQILFLV
jgi:hypothetical protein